MKGRDDDVEEAQKVKENFGRRQSLLVACIKLAGLRANQRQRTVDIVMSRPKRQHIISPNILIPKSTLGHTRMLMSTDNFFVNTGGSTLEEKRTIFKKAVMMQMKDFF